MKNEGAEHSGNLRLWIWCWVVSVCWALTLYYSITIGDILTAWITYGCGKIAYRELRKAWKERAIKNASTPK